MRKLLRLLWICMHLNYKRPNHRSAAVVRRRWRLLRVFQMGRTRGLGIVGTVSPRTGRAVKGARRAFILTLGSPSRPRKSHRERSETKFSEASFPGVARFSLGWVLRQSLAMKRKAFSGEP